MHLPDSDLDWVVSEAQTRNIRLILTLTNYFVSPPVAAEACACLLDRQSATFGACLSMQALLFEEGMMHANMASNLFSGINAHRGVCMGVCVRVRV